MQRHLRRPMVALPRFRPQVAAKLRPYRRRLAVRAARARAAFSMPTSLALLSAIGLYGGINHNWGDGWSQIVLGILGLVASIGLVSARRPVR